MSFNIEVDGGKTVKLPTAGKYCDRDIVVTAKEDTEGYNRGYTDGETAGHTAGLTEGIEQGKQAEQDEAWESIVPLLNTSGANLFAGRGWTDKTYNPKSSIVVQKGDAKTMYNNAQITSTKVPIELRVANADMMFASCGSLRTIPYLGFFGVTSSSSFFAGVTNLEDITVGGEIRSSIGFAGCPKLTNESVQSVIDHLADLTGQTALKITFHSAVLGKMTDEQYDAISTKNWTM